MNVTVTGWYNTLYYIVSKAFPIPESKQSRRLGTTL